MKVITLKQPWATLIIAGYKKYEFRSWKTNYRGKILIHTGKSIDKEGMDRVKHLNLEYPTSKILGEVEIIDCLELNSEINKRIIGENPTIYGHKEERTGYAWVLKNNKKIEDSRITKGKLGIWNI